MDIGASCWKNGGYLLSHLRSTIGAGGLNFSVRNGKRWNPATIATSIGVTYSQHGKKQRSTISRYITYRNLKAEVSGY